MLTALNLNKGDMYDAPYRIDIVRCIIIFGSKMHTVKSKIIFICGVVLVTVGIIGMLLPLLPTTPFLLLAAACFAKTSQKAHNWLFTNRWCGEYIRNYKEKKGMALKHKILSLSILWMTIGYSVVFFTESLWVRVLLLVIASGVTGHILYLNTYKELDASSGTIKDVILNLVKSENEQ